MTSTDLVNKCFEICSWIPLTMVKSLPLNSALLLTKNPALAFNCSYASSEKNSESSYSLRNPLTFADSFYILWNPITVTESITTSYIRLLRNPQCNKCADKIYVTGICTRNPLKFCKWNRLTIWQMFKGLSLEPGNTQTQNWAPIQWTVWTRNALLTLVLRNQGVR